MPSLPPGLDGSCSGHALPVASVAARHVEKRLHDETTAACARTAEVAGAPRQTAADHAAVAAAAA